MTNLRIGFHRNRCFLERGKRDTFNLIPYSNIRLVLCCNKAGQNSIYTTNFSFLFFSDTPGSKSSVTLSDLPEFLGGLSFEDSAEKDREEGNFCYLYMHLSQGNVFNVEM